MGPELLTAILGPIVGASVSLLVWVSKKNSEQLQHGFSCINTTINVIERKIDDMRVDVAKNYVSNDDLRNHIKSEEEWHVKFTEELSEMKKDIREMRNYMDRSHQESTDYGN